MSRHHSTTRLRILAPFMVATLGLSGLAGCGSDKSTNPPPGGGGSGSTSYTGTVTGNGANGKLTITVATSSPAPQTGTYGTRVVVNATGTFTPTGLAGIALTGSYDSGTKTLGVTGAGPWTFGGTLANGRMEGDGTYGSPVTAVGHFTLLPGTTVVTVIVGRYDNADPTGTDGDFNLSISGTEVHGSAVPDGGGDPIPLDGTYNSSTGAIHIVNPQNPSGPDLATGTYNSSTGAASGTYDTGTETGSWSGTRQ
jgi:hypothetical protein